MAVPTGMTWTREYLRKRGIPDEAIQWNPTTSAVSVYGQDFRPEYGENGRSYASPARLDAFLGQVEPRAAARRLSDAITAARNFRYNPDADPSFQQAQKGITRRVMNTMQDRGLLLSTQTPERIAQATAEALPQFESAAVQRNQQDIANLAALVDRYTQQQAADRSFALDEAQVTGRYVPAGSRGLVNRILELKTQAEPAGKAGASVAPYRSDADSLRARLAAMGVDPSLFGSDVTLEQATRNLPQLGQETEAGRARRVSEALSQQRASSGGSSGGSDGYANDSTQAVAYLASYDKSPLYTHLTPEQKRAEMMAWVDDQLLKGQMSLTAYRAALSEIDRRWPPPKQTTQTSTDLGGS